jgi:hypothetical protein
LVYTQPYAERVFALHNSLQYLKPEVALAITLGCNPPYYDNPPDSFLSDHSFDKNLSCHTYMEIPLLYMVKRLLTYLSAAIAQLETAHEPSLSHIWTEPSHSTARDSKLLGNGSSHFVYAIYGYGIWKCNAQRLRPLRQGY